MMFENRRRAMNFIPDSPIVSRPYCPGCEPDADPTREILDVRWCEDHMPRREGAEDAGVVANAYLSGSVEADYDTCRKYAIMIRRTEEERWSERMRKWALRIREGVDITPCEKSYRTRKWKPYKVPIGSPSIPPLEPNNAELIVCRGDSKKAAELKEDPRRFYFDREQVAAGLDKIYGVDRLAQLREDWQGHPKGTLVLVVFLEVAEEPPCVTCLVEMR